MTEEQVKGQNAKRKRQNLKDKSKGKTQDDGRTGQRSKRKVQKAKVEEQVKRQNAKRKAQNPADEPFSLIRGCCGFAF